MLKQGLHPEIQVVVQLVPIVSFAQPGSRSEQEMQVVLHTVIKSGAHIQQFVVEIEVGSSGQLDQQLQRAGTAARQRNAVSLRIAGFTDTKVTRERDDGRSRRLLDYPVSTQIRDERRQAVTGTELSSPLDIGDDLPRFPPGTRSLLAKYLTPEVWSALRDEVDDHGFTFRQAIFSGCRNTDSSIGVYAGSHDSYRTFAALFDPIIEHYHGHSADANHRADMDASRLDCPPLPPSQSDMILSTRIRVARNLAEFPLGPALSSEQRKAVEAHVIAAAGQFRGDLQGRYYALPDLTPSQREQLIADHFLFKEGDRFLEAAGLNRDWPEARGIFHNHDKTFLTWVNEEDQLRIIAMQPGFDLYQVFDRLARGVAGFEDRASFARDDHLGYITSCPSNLGTGLRASVHVRLPHLGRRQEEFEGIADRHQVQIRGIHGEHSESAGHVYDISNKRRLGRSEVELVQDMYNGVRTMLERELALSAGE